MLSPDEVSPRFEPRATPVARVPARAIMGRAALAAAYLALMARLGTTSASHWALAAVLVAGPLVPPRLRDVLRDAIPFLLFVAIYDALGLVRVHVAAGGVHTFWPYWLDRALFGVPSRAGPLSLNELFARHHWAGVDLVAGLVYLAYIYVVAICAIFLGIIDRSPAGRWRLRALGWTFLGVNLAAFTTYLLLPVAPPWYVATHGFGPVDVNAVASPAALVRWDALTGIPYFASFYSRSSDVFGAMPSMHCAYPTLLLLYVAELRRPRLLALMVVFQLLTCFSAVYLQHHYVLDVLVGTSYAIIGYRLERWLTARIGQTARERQAP
jgi:inositol phosphorylceramide synthase catalytic subunit